MTDKEYRNVKNMSDKMFTFSGVNGLLDLLDKFSHQIEEQGETIEDLQKEIKRLHKVFDIKDSERVKLVKENKELKSEIRFLNLQNNSQKGLIINLNDGFNNLTELLAKRTAENAEIDEENKVLKLKIKMMTKNKLNHIYGTTVYTDTDSIKETKDNDSNN